MLFYLEDPVGLRRTRYLQIEDQAAAQELGVYLFLPAGGRQVMTIAPGSHGEGLLGSDFSYNDLRLKLPVHACNYRFLGSDVLDGRRVWKIEALQSRPELPWNRAILYLAQDRPFLLGADYYSHAVGQPDATVKIMRVQKFRDIGPVRTAVRMTMSARDGNSTIILLQDTRLGIRGISPAWLEPATLGSPALDGDPFRQMGWGAMAK
jgi:hypothetical protein